MKFKDVQIVVTDNRPYIPMPFFIRVPPPPDPDMWYITYHKEYRKWIITNDINRAGLEERQDKVQVIGYAGDINNALFAIYNHQTAIGHKPTVMDEIRQQRAVRASDAAWTWGKPIKQAPPEYRFERVRELIEQNPVFDGWTIEEWEPPKPWWKKLWK